uniref:hypothetical protein n=1 Tax=Synarthrophyton patena TaxID=48972 RepID=UPI002181F65E|nr:hypothetical protein N4M48_pgp054 [Synarthrophyton patena]UVF62967.1 hypothetical protein [Synarthrophyton patena]
MNFTKVKESGYLHNQKDTIISSAEISINSYLLLSKNINNIIFQGINNQLIKNIVLEKIYNQTFFSAQSNLNINKINSIINTLRCSGSFNSIKAFYLLFNQYQYLVIQLKVNNVIKEIIIQNTNKIKIPKKFLMLILKKQIGRPKNLKLIHEIIENIKNWYNIRGYKWIKVSCKIPASNLSQLNLFINENIINEIKINSAHTKIKISEKNLESFILHKLNIVLGKTINIYHIELGILKLKAQKIILSCDYKVQYISKNTLKINIEYNYLDAGKYNLLNRSIYLNDKLMNFIYKESCKAFSYLWHRLIDASNFKQIINTSLEHTAINCNDKTLVLSNLLNIIYKYQDSKFNIKQNHLQIKYSINIFNNLLNKFIIDLKQYQGKQSLIISYKYLKLDNSNYNDCEILLCIFQKIYKIKNFILQVIFKNTQYKQIFFDNYHNFYGIKINFIKNFISKFYISQKFNIYNYTYKMNFLYNVNSWNTIHKFCKLNNYLIINKFHQINQQLINYTIIISSQALQLRQNLIPQNIWNFSFHTYMPLIIHFEEFTKNAQINHLINIDYTKVINFSQNRLNILVNTLICQIKLRAFYNFVQKISITRLSNWQRLQNYTINLKEKKEHFDANLEYCIYKKYHILLCLLYNYHQIINQINLDNSKYEINQKNTLSHSIGTGIEINLPIYQLPIIRLNHEFYCNGTSRLYVKLSFK